MVSAYGLVMHRDGCVKASNLHVSVWAKQVLLEQLQSLQAKERLQINAT